MTSKDLYRSFCESRNDLPLFMQPFWLDISCDPGKWDVVLSKDEKGSIRGVWAYYYGTKRGIQWMRLPILTPFTAVWIRKAEEGSTQKEIAYNHEVIEDLEHQLPRVQIFELKLPWTFQDWLPLCWRGYRQNTRYTFRFPEIHEEAIHANFSKSFRRNLRAAERHYTIEEGNVGDLYAMMERVFEMRDAHVLFSEKKLNEIVNALKERNQCHIYAARDYEGVQATVFIAWDATTSYYLIGGRRRTDSRHGMNLLLWTAIRDAARRGHAFDFEGSMIEGVNKFFQNFGAELTPYHYIYKYRGVARLMYLR